MKLPNKFSIKIENESQSRAAQEKLFGLGYSWAGGGNKWNNINGDFFLDVNYYGNNFITYSCQKAYCDPLFSYEEFMEKEKTDKAETEIIGYYTDYSFAFWVLVAEWAADKEIKVESRNGTSSIRFESDKVWDSSCSTLFLKESNRKYLEPLEFLAKIKSLPEKKKEIVINGLPWVVKIKGENVSIGCQNSTLSNLAKVIGEIQRNKGGKLNEYSVEPRRDGVHIDGKVVSWEDWDSFVYKFGNFWAK